MSEPVKEEWEKAFDSELAQIMKDVDADATWTQGDTQRIRQGFKAGWRSALKWERGAKGQG